MSPGRKLNAPGPCFGPPAMVGRPSPQNPDQPITLVTRSDKLHFPGEFAEPNSNRIPDGRRFGSCALSCLFSDNTVRQTHGKLCSTLSILGNGGEQANPLIQATY